ncbi:MAG: ECF-type sigma factor [Pseudomonadota bacterium]
METTFTQSGGHASASADAELDCLVYPPIVRRGADALIADHYETLKRIARAKRRAQKVGNTLHTTDLLHESYARISKGTGFSDDTHFLSSAALAMRHVLADYAKSKMRAKRGAGQAAVSFDLVEHAVSDLGSSAEEIVTVTRLMSALARFDARLVQVVDCLYFAGFTLTETSEIVGVSSKTVQRDWSKARAFLKARASANTS